MLKIQKSYQAIAQRQRTDTVQKKQRGITAPLRYGGEVRIQTVVQLIKFGGYRQFSVLNPPQRKAANRYQ